MQSERVKERGETFHEDENEDGQEAENEEQHVRHDCTHAALHSGRK